MDNGFYSAFIFQYLLKVQKDKFQSLSIISKFTTMSYILISYSLYLALTLLLTVWVARTLFRNGKVFLIDIFHGNKELAQAVNNLLLVGFYLVNIGYAVYTLSIANAYHPG